MEGEFTCPIQHKQRDLWPLKLLVSSNSCNRKITYSYLKDLNTAMNWDNNFSFTRVMFSLLDSSTSICFLLVVPAERCPDCKFFSTPSFSVKELNRVLRKQC